MRSRIDTHTTEILNSRFVCLYFSLDCHLPRLWWACVMLFKVSREKKKKNQTSRNQDRLNKNPNPSL
jgi:hypothetical protein